MLKKWALKKGLWKLWGCFMINSAQAVKDRLKNISKQKGVPFNSVLRLFMYDRFIERLAKSKYNDNFILKGGFYLSSLFGIDNRSTIDIDTAVRKLDLNSNEIERVINEIINIDVDDNIKFKITNIMPIREEDEYGGLRVTIEFRLEQMRDSFHIDIATGDPIYPGPCNYQYESLLGKDSYKLWSYNLETIVAEKIETIFSRMETSSRMKDYYDLYLIHKLAFAKIDKNKLKGATERTFKKRNFNADLHNNLIKIRNSAELRDNWKDYSRKNDYAQNIEFDEILNCLEIFINIISLNKD